jgi:GNAT superfamily N-acetyltransferase
LTTSVDIRAYSHHDIEACRRLWLERTEWHRFIYNDSSIGDDRTELYFDRHPEKVVINRLLVLDVDSQVVGLVGLEYVGKELFIEPPVIDSQHRGIGYGTALLDKAIKEAQKMGESSLSVKLVACN